MNRMVLLQETVGSPFQEVFKPRLDILPSEILQQESMEA